MDNRGIGVGTILIPSIYCTHKESTKTKTGESEKQKHRKEQSQRGDRLFFGLIRSGARAGWMGSRRVGGYAN